MLNIIDCTIPDFLEQIKGRLLIAAGAGRLFEKFIATFHLEKQIVFAIDNDSNKWNTEIYINSCKIEIKAPEAILNVPDLDFFILITGAYGIFDIVEQLDNIDKLNRKDCFVCSLMQEKCKKQEIIFPKGEQKIPKIIHYCWFGKTEIPDHLQQYMRSWKEKCPDYEIIRWDESNYDIAKNDYMKEAYEYKKWGFVPDYARLDIIYEHGGIYLDTDVEILRSFDDLLCCSSFMGFFDYNDVNIGSGFGAEKKNELIKEMRDYYVHQRFLKKDGTVNTQVCSEYQNPILLKYGFELNNKWQMKNNNILYPMDVFNPEGKVGYHKCYTENTHSVHWAQISYEKDAAKMAYKKSKEKLRQRLMECEIK